MEPVTYVTGFLLLRKKENNPSVGTFICSDEKYLEYAEQLLAVPINLILFMDPDLVNWATKIRKKYGLESKTRVVETTIESLPLYRKFDQIRDNISRNPIKNFDFRKFTPLYLTVVNSKLYFLDRAIQLNPFGTDRWAWIDFRIQDLSPSDPAIFYRVDLDPMDRIRLPQMNYISPAEIKNRSEYYSKNRGKIAGGFLAGRQESLLKLIDAFNSELESILNLGFAPSEEQVYGVLVGEHPEWFKPYFADYKTTFTNFSWLVRDLQCALWYLTGAYTHRDYSGLDSVTSYLQEGYRRGWTQLDNNQIFEIWYKSYLANWYLGQIEKGRENIKELIRLSRESTDLRAVIQSRKEFLKVNLGYLRDSEINEYLENLE